VLPLVQSPKQIINVILLPASVLVSFLIFPAGINDFFSLFVTFSHKFDVGLANFAFSGFLQQIAEIQEARIL